MLSLVGSFIRQPQSCFIPERWAEIPSVLSFQAFPSTKALGKHRSHCVKGWRPLWKRKGDELHIVGWPCEVERW